MKDGAALRLFDERDRTAALGPEERLLLAIVENAWRELYHSHPRVVAAAAAFFQDDEPGDNPCNFNRICEHFGWDQASIVESLGLSAGRCRAVPKRYATRRQPVIVRQSRRSGDGDVAGAA
jgi:hypothetical protein